MVIQIPTIFLKANLGLLYSVFIEKIWNTLKLANYMAGIVVYSYFINGAYKDKVRKMVLNNAIFLPYLNEGFDTSFQMVDFMGC